MRVGNRALLSRLNVEAIRAIHGKYSLSAIMLGPTGCGKTTIAALMVLRAAPVSVDWVYAVDLLMADRYHRLGEGEPPLVTTAKNAMALVIDDIGKEPNQQALASVLNHRYHNGLPTIATSGLTRDELTATIGAAAVRRLKDQHAGHEVLVIDMHEGAR